jgi:two-component system, cell cycle sensor histidine kinase and response regulator CckA
MVDSRTKSGKVALVAAVAAVVTCIGVLIGWLFDLDFLKRLSPGFVSMNPMTAVALILAGVSLALFLWSPRGRDEISRGRILTARLCALVVLLIGLARLLALTVGWDLGVDQWLFASKLADGLHTPSLIAPSAALNFCLLGGALLVVDREKRIVRSCCEGSVIVVGFGSVLATLGYCYGIQAFYRFGEFIPMALHAAMTFIILTVALLLSHTDRGLLAVFAGEKASGTMTRRLMPAVILIPAGFGWLELRGELTGTFDSTVGNALFAVANILVFTFLVCRNARELHAEELAYEQAEEAFRESQRRFYSAFEHAPIAVALVSPAFKWLKVNLALCELFGYSEAELLARSVQDITHPDDVNLSLSSIRRLIDGEAASFSIEKRYIHRRGHVIMGLLYVALIRDAHSQPSYFIAQINDIGERKRAGEIAEQLAAIVENSDDAIISKTTDGIITSWNPGAERMFGHTAQEMIGESSKTLVPLDRPDEESEILAGFARGEVVRHIESVRFRKDGQRFDISATISPIKHADGRIVVASEIVRDITGRKRFEAQLFQSQKMETVGKLAGGVAHEFNGIMTTIIGESEVLLGGLPSRSSLAGNAISIQKAAGRAATLTRQLLAYGRKQVLQSEILDLNLLLADMESSLRLLMGRGAELVIAPGAGLKAVMIDPQQMKQVMVNLVMNAADAMPNGGKLTLETANVTLDHESVGRFPELKVGDYVMLAVSDTGTGMSDEVKSHVFEPFFTTKGVGQGAGLGLSTCYGIIKQSGGLISLHSERGRGTRFEIHLPQTEPNATISVERLDSPNLPGGSETILLVEYATALREMSAALLRRLGYTVFSTASGIEALRLQQQGNLGRIDLLFSLFVMPQMSGLELAEHVHAFYPHTRVLFTFGYAEDALIQQCPPNHGWAFLQKPFTPTALAQKVRDVIERPKKPRNGL